MKSQTLKVPCVVNGEKVSLSTVFFSEPAQIFTKNLGRQEVCADHQRELCTFHQADRELVKKVAYISFALRYRQWRAPYQQRQAGKPLLSRTELLFS